MTNGWGLVDLGVCRLPTVGFPTRPELSIRAGAIYASGAAGPGIIASPGGLAINEIICLPDKNLTLVLENQGGPVVVSANAFSGVEVPLLGQSDGLGHSWSPALNNANAINANATGGAIYEFGPGYVGVRRDKAQTATTVTFDADRLAGILSDSMSISARPIFKYGLTFPFAEARLFKDLQASAFVQARLTTSGFLSLEAATGAAAGNVLASRAIPTLSENLPYLLSLQVQGPQSWVTLSRSDGGPVFAPGSTAQASIGVASNAAVAGAGAPALAIAFPSSAKSELTFVEAWQVTGLPTSNLLAFDSYRIDGPNTDSYRTASSGVFAGQKLAAVQRGAFPKAAPSTSSVAVVMAPFDQGCASDLISAVVRVRERFTMAF
jgi:hypothetical protein